ncbi:MAG: hypothetical protein NTV30_00420, partial [Chloroflexi bacterium]|nr:hypothetical protein [Chloroflexota bacterium]
GAALTQMERSGGAFSPSGYEFPWYGTGNPHNTWYACTIVDANGKEVPYVDRDGNVIKNVADRYQPAPGQKFFGERCIAYPYKKASLIPDLLDRVRKGEYKLPLYADLPGMPEKERKVIFGMMVGQEGKTKIPILSTYTKAGFNPKKDLLQSYIDGGIDNVRKGDPNARTFGEVGDAGGLVIDWDLKTTLEGLYAAGDQVFAGNYHHHAATTGRYAGRKAAAYSMKVKNSTLDRSQIETEKLRVYAPVKKSNGIEWKDLNHGLSMVMQNYCGELKNEELLKIGLLWLKDIEVNEAANACAPDPHKLGRTLDVLDLITSSQVIINACLARKASSKFLNFIRMDYPSIDPPDWNKWLTIRMENGVIKTGELSLDFEFPLSENYEKHNKDYQGWYRS